MHSYKNNGMYHNNMRNIACIHNMGEPKIINEGFFGPVGQQNPKPVIRKENVEVEMIKQKLPDIYKYVADMYKKDQMEYKDGELTQGFIDDINDINDKSHATFDEQTLRLIIYVNIFTTTSLRTPALAIQFKNSREIDYIGIWYMSDNYFIKYSPRKYATIMSIIKPLDLAMHISKYLDIKINNILFDYQPKFVGYPSGKNITCYGLYMDGKIGKEFDSYSFENKIDLLNTKYLPSQIMFMPFHSQACTFMVGRTYFTSEQAAIKLIRVIKQSNNGIQIIANNTVLAPDINWSRSWSSRETSRTFDDDLQKIIKTA